MELHQQQAALRIPDGEPEREALARTTHLGIGAHHDDLEIMALHGIMACHGRQDRWFGGITCTNGAGSARAGEFAAFSDEQMIEVRRREQDAAARIGQYGFMAQLAYPSASIQHARNPEFVTDLRHLLSASKPEVIYTHNPADKHDTHIAVVAAVVEAVRGLPPAERPGRLLGCEVWRDLDWMPDQAKVILDVSGHGGLARQLTDVFQSQIAGGKRYDLAAEGRRRANATFLRSHDADTMSEVCVAMELTPLIQNDGMKLTAYALHLVDRFREDVQERLRGA